MEIVKQLSWVQSAISKVILVLCGDREKGEEHGEVHYSYRDPYNSTGNDKSTVQQQYGSALQLLPLSRLPEGQKEFSSRPCSAQRGKTVRKQRSR